MNPENLGELLAQRKWIPAAAAAIWLIVRLLKSDTKIPFDIPPRVRALSAIVLGVLAGVLDKVIASPGTRWETAIFDGLVAGIGAIFIHVMIVDTARGGKEIPLGPLTIQGARPAPGKPVTDPPPAGGGDRVLQALLFVGGMALVSHLILACGYGKTACTVIDIVNQNCAWIKYLDENGQVKEVQVNPEELKSFARATAAKRAAEKAASSSDGGVP